MVRNTAREIAIHLSYELSFTDKPVEELLDERLTPESFAALAEEDPLYQETPNAKQADYIRRLVRGVADHAPELDGYIAKYAKGWNFARIPLVASAIMRVAMYEILYMPDIPHGASINEAVELAKAKKEIQEKDAEIDREGKIAGVFCKAYEKAVLLDPTEENVRIWAKCTRMTRDEMEDTVKESRELAEVFRTIADLMERLLPERGTL